MSRRHRQRWTIIAIATALCAGLMACQPQPVADPQAASTHERLPDALQHALADPVRYQGTNRPPGEMPPPVEPEGPQSLQSVTFLTPADRPSACLAQASSDTQRGGALRRWTDDKGHTHYSDQAPPAGMAATTISAGGVQTRIGAEGAVLDRGLDQRVQTYLGELESLFSTMFALPPRPAARLDIAIVARQETLADLVTTPLAASSSGAYLPAQQKIYLHRHENAGAFEQILRHELAHSMVHRMVGQLPVPLNEGFAGWFQHGGVDAPEGHAATALRHALVGAAPHDAEQAWVELLASDSLHFHRDQREKSYLRAYALVAVLMADDAGRNTVAEIMRAQRRQPCVPLSWEREIATHYPGGLAALMQHWQAFMNDPLAWMGIASRGFASMSTLS